MNLTQLTKKNGGAKSWIQLVFALSLRYMAFQLFGVGRVNSCTRHESHLTPHVQVTDTKGFIGPERTILSLFIARDCSQRRTVPGEWDQGWDKSNFENPSWAH